MEARPRIRPPLSETDKFLEKSGITLFLIMWGVAIYVFYISPAIIPIHYNLAGKIDGYGAKATLFLASGIASLVYWLLTTLNKYPYIFNYMVPITQENAVEQYSSATRILRFLKVSVVIIVLIVNFYAYSAAKGNSAGPGVWFVPFLFILLLTPTIVLLIKSFRIKQ